MSILSKDIRKKSIDSAAAEIVCMVLHPFIYDENIDVDSLFKCIDSKFSLIMWDKSMLIETGREWSGIEDLQNEIRAALKEGNY